MNSTVRFIAPAFFASMLAFAGVAQADDRSGDCTSPVVQADGSVSFGTEGTDRGGKPSIDLGLLELFTFPK